MDKIPALSRAMIEYYEHQTGRITHFLSVWGFARTIAELEGCDEKTLFIIEAAALTHDIGIKISEQKYQSSEARYQELEGPPVAQKMLLSLGFDPDVTERVCWLIAHHHQYDHIDALDYQVLVEADFLVNLQKYAGEQTRAQSVHERIFKTKAGRTLLCSMYL